MSELKKGPGGRLEDASVSAKQRNEAAFVSTFVTAGYPAAKDTPDILLAMQEGGVAVIELGIPYTGPQADGATIQHTNQVAIAGGTSKIPQCLAMVEKARSVGLTIPVVLMGYFQFGVDKLCEATKAAGADGFIVVDLPPEEGIDLGRACAKNGLSNIPLIAPTTSDDRIDRLCKVASTFVYCVSLAGVTGARSELPSDLEEFIARVRSKTELPLAVGFGISNPKMVRGVANIADGVVVGSAVLKAMDSAGKSTAERASVIKDIVSHFVTGVTQAENAKNQATAVGKVAEESSANPDKSRFGKFGGQFIPETLFQLHLLK